MITYLEYSFSPHTSAGFLAVPVIISISVAEIPATLKEIGLPIFSNHSFKTAIPRSSCYASNAPIGFFIPSMKRINQESRHRIVINGESIITKMY